MMPNRLNESIEAMARRFSSFDFTMNSTGGDNMGSWTGSVQPIKTSSGLFELLDDLENDRDIYIVGSEVRHLPDCKNTHRLYPWMQRVEDLNTTFQLQIVYTGGEAVPKTWVLAPVIPAEKRLHMWADNSICAFLPSREIWNWSKDTVADYLPHVLVWLVKWMVFSQANVWIGAQHQCTPQYHLAILSGKDLCWCGSGDEYRHCHRKDDEVKAGLVAPRWLRPQPPRWVRSQRRR